MSKMSHYCIVVKNQMQKVSFLASEASYVYFEKKMLIFWHIFKLFAKINRINKGQFWAQKFK